MKRLISLVLALGVLLAVSGCEGGAQAGDGAIRIGVAVYKSDDTYISNMTAVLQENVTAYREKTGERVYTNISDAQESQTTQNDQIDRFIALGYDVLCVNLVDRTDAARVVDKARAANVPVVFFNREPVLEDLKTWNKAYYVGSNARESARLQAQIVLDMWNRDSSTLDKNGDGTLQYIMLEGETRHQDTMIRTEVSVQTLKDGGVPMERVDGGIANWDRNQAAALTENCFSNHPGEIELVLCNNDDMALGVADAIDRLGLKFSHIVGIDGTPQGVEAVESGRILGTVVMDYAAHAEAILNMALALAKDSDVTKVIQVGEDSCVRIPMHTLQADDSKD